MEKCFVVWRGVGSLCEISNHDSPPTTIIYLMEDIIAIMTSDDTLKLVVIHFSFRIIEYEIQLSATFEIFALGDAFVCLYILQ